MKSVVASAAILYAGLAFSCPSPKPPNCTCDKTTNTWITNNTWNTVNKNTTATGGNATVSNSGNSSNTNKNSQEQGQKQTQTSTSSVGNVGSTSSAVVGNVTSSSGPSSSTSTASGNGDGSNNTQITSNYSAAKIPVNTAYSASLTSGIDTCLGSMSGGAQTSFLGITLGKTNRDKNCEMIKQVHMLQETGHSRAACFRMQQGKEGEAIRQAMKDAGEECPPLVVEPVPEVTTVVVQAPEDGKYVTQEELELVIKKLMQK